MLPVKIGQHAEGRVGVELTIGQQAVVADVGAVEGENDGPFAGRNLVEAACHHRLTLERRPAGLAELPGILSKVGRAGGHIPQINRVIPGGPQSLQILPQPGQTADARRIGFCKRSVAQHQNVPLLIRGVKRVARDQRLAGVAHAGVPQQPATATAVVSGEHLRPNFLGAVDAAIKGIIGEILNPGPDDDIGVGRFDPAHASQHTLVDDLIGMGHGETIFRQARQAVAVGRGVEHRRDDIQVGGHQRQILADLKISLVPGGVTEDIGGQFGGIGREGGVSFGQ